MSHLPGQPHRSGGHHLPHHPLTPHEVTVRAQAAPAPPGLRRPEATPAQRPAPGRRRQRFPVGSITVAGLPYFLIPDDDPWRRERWRRLGDLPDPDAL